MAHEGFSSPTLVNNILQGFGHQSTALTAARVAAGELVSGGYEVFVVGRNTTSLGASLSYTFEVSRFVSLGGNIVTEMSGAGMFFTSYSSDVRPISVTFTRQLGIFSGVVHGGSFLATNTPVDVMDPSHPVMLDMPDPFAEGGGTEHFFWVQSSDSRLHRVACFTGNGNLGFPVGQALPCGFAAVSGRSRFVFGAWDWADTLGVNGLSRRFFRNAVNFAATGPNEPPLVDLVSAFDVECTGAEAQVVLDVRGSMDPESNPLTFSWTSDCPGAVFSDPSAPLTTLSLDTSGGCGFFCTATVEVSDGATVASASAQVMVNDMQSPVITLVGGGFMVLAAHQDVYVEQGAMSADTCDGEAPAMVGGDVVSDTVPGTYRVTYNAMDRCGNAAAEVVRTVEVRDVMAPSFTVLPNDLVVEAEGPAGVDAMSPAVAAFLSTVQVSDDCDPNAGIVHDAPGVFPLGETVVTWTARDFSGNEVSASRRVTVVDTTAPMLACPGNVVRECPHDTSWEANGAASAMDTVSTPVVTYSDSIMPGCGGTVMVTRTWTATDAAGNSSSCMQNVTLVDSMPPQVLLAVSPLASGQWTVEFSAADGCSAVEVSAEVDTGCLRRPVLSGEVVVLSEADFACRADGSPTYLARLNVTAVDACGNNAMTGQDLLYEPVQVGPQFVRGDADGNELLETTDALAIFMYAFAMLNELPCLDAADANDDGTVDMPDGLALLNHYLHSGGPTPPPPFPAPGSDPTPDQLGCAQYPSQSPVLEGQAGPKGKVKVLEKDKGNRIARRR